MFGLDRAGSSQLHPVRDRHDTITIKDIRLKPLFPLPSGPQQGDRAKRGSRYRYAVSGRLRANSGLAIFWVALEDKRAGEGRMGVIRALTCGG